MGIEISPVGNDQFFASNGVLGVGYKLFTYLAGSTTKTPVYTDITGLSNHTNPIVLDADGLPPAPIYLTKGKAYKFVYAAPADSDPPASPIFPIDDINIGQVITEGGNITGGINETRSTVASATAPDIFAVTVGNTVDYTGVVACSGFVAAPQAGAQRLLVCASTPSFVAGANLVISGLVAGQTYTARANDKILAIAVTTTVFHLIPIADRNEVRRALALGALF